MGNFFIPAFHGWTIELVRDDTVWSTRLGILSHWIEAMMAQPAGKAESGVRRSDFDYRLKLEFHHGGSVGTNVGLVH